MRSYLIAACMDLFCFGLVLGIIALCNGGDLPVVKPIHWTTAKIVGCVLACAFWVWITKELLCDRWEP